MEISESLKRLRKGLHLSQRQLSEKIGIPYQSYQTYEYGNSVPSANVVKRLAQAFNVTSDYVLGISDEPRTKPADEVLVNELVICRDSMQKVLAMVDKVTGGKGNDNLQDNEQAQSENLRRPDQSAA